MSLAFVDTSAWLAIMVARETNHRAATEFLRSSSRLITSNAVLSEAFTWLNYRGNHSAAVALEQRLAAAERMGLLRIAWVTKDVHRRAWSIFERHGDQKFSFCDCASAVIARDSRADFVFAFDRDFATMGFDMRPYVS